MKKTTLSLLISCLILFLVTNLAVSQKLFEGFWEQTSKSNSSYTQMTKQEETQRVYYKVGKMKTVDISSGDMMIFRLDKGVFWQVKKNQGTYTEVKFDEMQAEMDAAMKNMQEELKNMSPEEKEMMKKMMGGKMGAMLGGEEGFKITVKKTNETKNINGYNCHKVIYLLNDEPLLDFWLTNKYQLGSEFVEAYQKMGFLKGDLTDAKKNFKGFPILTEMKMDTGVGTVETVTTVTKIVTQPVSDSEFELPKGLKKQKSPMMH